MQLRDMVISDCVNSGKKRNLGRRRLVQQERDWSEGAASGERADGRASGSGTEQMARLQKEKRVSKREKEKDLEKGTWVGGRGRGREGAP